jgi:hypothetical protein
MGLIKVKMKQLTKADPTHLSLVRRGANLIPFRIQKAAGDTMAIDLTSISRILKGEKRSSKCEIAGLVVKKTAKMDAVIEAIQKAGFKTDQLVEHDDGTVMFVQKTDPEDGATLIRQSPHLVLVVKGFQHSEQVAAFNAALGAEGYVEGFRGATNAFPALVESVAKADVATAQGTIQKAMEDYHTFAHAMVEALPQEAFLADELISAAVQKAAGANDGSAAVAQPATAATTQPGPQTLQTPAANPEMPTSNGAELSKNSTNTRGPIDGKVPPKKKLNDTSTVASGAGAGGEMQPGKDVTANSDDNGAVGATGSTNDGAPNTPPVNSSVKDTSASSVVKGDAEVAAAAAAAAVAATQGKDKGKKKPADAEDAADGGADEAEEDASSANADEGIAPKKKNPFAEEMKKGFDELKGLIGGLATAVSTVQKAQAETAAKVEAAEKVAKESVQKAADLEKKVSSTVLGAPPAADRPSGEKIIKSDEDPSKGPVGDGYWDSSQHRRR